MDGADIFSDGDVSTVKQFGMPLYLANPDGDMRVLKPGDPGLGSGRTSDEQAWQRGLCWKARLRRTPTIRKGALTVCATSTRWDGT
jgi:hypothetical protein